MGQRGHYLHPWAPQISQCARKAERGLTVAECSSDRAATLSAERSRADARPKRESVTQVFRGKAPHQNLRFVLFQSLRIATFVGFLGLRQRLLGNPRCPQVQLAAWRQMIPPDTWLESTEKLWSASRGPARITLLPNQSPRRRCASAHHEGSERISRRTALGGCPRPRQEYEPAHPAPARGARSGVGAPFDAVVAVGWQRALQAHWQ